MFSYYKIVFGIKHRYQISDVLHIFQQLRFYSYLISEHNALDMDSCCDRPDVHYHGLIELFNDEGKIGIFLMQLVSYCIFIKEDHCSNPAEYLAYITLEPKRTIAQEICYSSKLVEYLNTTCSTKSEVLRKKVEKKIYLMERNNYVICLVEFILNYGCNSNNLYSRLRKNESLWASLHNSKDFKSIVGTALNLSKKIINSRSILDLSNSFELTDEYLTAEESVLSVKKWCSYQKLDPREFTKNLIRCLDKKSGNRNSIYLQGSPNSGKTYIVQSIIDACIHVGQVMVESTAYPFVWEKCVDKRLIVLKEPHFSMENFDQLDKILSGSGTLIYKHNDMVEYLQPAPVIILANEHGWTKYPELGEKIKKRFFCSYLDLKTFPLTNEKKLHPRWISLLNKALTSKSDSTAKQPSSRTSCERPLQSDMNIGMKTIAEERRNDGDKNLSSHSSKTDGDCDLLTRKIVMKENQDSENTMDSNLKSRKRPLGNIGPDGGRKKMHIGSM